MMKQSDLSNAIQEQVRVMYETFPYPHYPLLAKPRWQEGYLASSLLLSRLANDVLGHPFSVSLGGGRSREVLVAGSGEMQPYVIAKLEPTHHNITCVDLSAQSLKRARIRMLTSRQPIRFVACDVVDYLQTRPPETFDHVEAYGVLHHLSEPSLCCQLLWSRLRPGGSMRVMVYNARARHWIHQLQKVFRLIGLSPYLKQDLKLARQLLQLTSFYLPSLRSKLEGMSAHTLKNDTRLIDTFFHVRELTISPQRWLELFDNEGFKALSLFDRFGELDDLPNPLWRCPTIEEINERSADGRYENNLELVLYKNLEGTSTAFPRKTPAPLMLRKASPPLVWFDFRETKSISLTQRYLLWHSHINYVWGQEFPHSLQKTLAKLPLPTMQRLARLGALLPGMVASRALRADLKAPMVKHMLPPDSFQRVTSATTPLKGFIENALQQKDRYSCKRRNLILHRLDRAQASHDDTPSAPS